MTIGTQTPGINTQVTPDTNPAPYVSVFGPAPDGLVVADDVLAAIQVALNVQGQLTARPRVYSGGLGTMISMGGVNAGDIFIANEGAYLAVAGDTTTEYPWEARSNGMNVPSIFWRRVGRSILSGTAGLARVGPLLGVDSVTPPGKIPVGLTQNRLFGSYNLATAGLISQTVTSGATTALTNGSTILGEDLLADDIIEGTIGPIYVGSAATATWAKLRLNCVQGYGGGSPYSIAITQRQVLANSAAAGAGNMLTFSFRQSISTPGHLQLLLYGIAGADGGLSVQSFDDLEYSIGVARIWRP
jgi:hypothetical protein